MPSFTLVPHLIVTNGPEAIAFYKQAFGAVEAYPPNLTPDGRLLHAELRIGDAMFYLCEDFTDAQDRTPRALGGTPVTLNLTVDDADAVFDQAVKAGATVTMPMEDTFWGARYGKVTDPSGHDWAINQQVREVSPEELKKGAEAFCE